MVLQRIAADQDQDLHFMSVRVALVQLFFSLVARLRSKKERKKKDTDDGV